MRACLPVSLSVCFVFPLYLLPVCLCFCLPVFAFACLSLCMPSCLCACLPACLPDFLSANLSVCLSVCLFACLPISQSVCCQYTYFEGPMSAQQWAQRRWQQCDSHTDPRKWSYSPPPAPPRACAARSAGLCRARPPLTEPEGPGPLALLQNHEAPPLLVWRISARRVKFGPGCGIFLRSLGTAEVAGRVTCWWRKLTTRWRRPRREDCRAGGTSLFCAWLEPGMVEFWLCSSVISLICKWVSIQYRGCQRKEKRKKRKKKKKKKKREGGLVFFNLS